MEEVSRSSSAPIIRLQEESSDINQQHKTFKDEQLTPWSIDGLHDFKTRSLSDNKEVKKLPTKSFSTTSVPSKKLYSKYKSSKWYLKENDNKESGYIFRHCTDTNKYMEEYRSTKVEKMKSMEEKTNSTSSLSPDTSSQEDYVDFHSVVNKTMSFRDGIAPYGYRLADYQSVTTKGQQKPRVLSSPVKVRGNKIPDWRQHSNPKNMAVCSLPKCDGVVLPGRTVFGNHDFLPEHLLQCRKLSELSISPKPSDYTNTLNDNWRPQPIRKRGNLKVHQNRGTHTNVKYNDYSHIIKHVLEHYDPSQNPVRSQITKSETLKSNTYLLASTY